jgi:GNAT superfamily N-acetyltransferase
MIKIVNLKKEYSGFIDSIVEFYAPKYKSPFLKETVENSTMICLAYDNDKIIGAIRAISDLSRHGLIVDLMVSKEYRNQKIGTKLLNAIVDELRKYNVKNINITTEPGIDWLADFYKINGFEELKESVCLKLKS